MNEPLQERRTQNEIRIAEVMLINDGLPSFMTVELDNVKVAHPPDEVFNHDAW